MARSLYDVLKNIDSQYVQGPADIYYMDEIGGRLVRQRSLNTVAPKGAKHPRTAGDLRSDDSKVARLNIDYEYSWYEDCQKVMILWQSGHKLCGPKFHTRAELVSN